MLGYRLYFVNRSGAIQAREEFFAPSDDVALVVASVVCRACSDICHTYELWQDGRQVLAFDGSRADTPVGPTDDQAARIQKITLRVEESLQRSHWTIARSLKLIEETELLRARVGHDD